MFCLKCGNKLPENAVFCPLCGTKCSTKSINAPDQSGLNNQASASKPQSKRLLLALLGIAVIAIVIFALLSSNRPGSDRSTDADEPTEGDRSGAIIDIDDDSVNSSISQESSVVSTPVDYAGEWMDSYSQRCYMTIEKFGDSAFSVEIHWSSSASMDTIWSMIARISSQTGELEYQNCVQKKEIYKENGSIEEDIVYIDGTGKFYYDGSYLYWLDDKENAGEQCKFIKDGGTAPSNTIETGVFSITIPSDWEERYIYDNNEYFLSFYEKQSYYDLNQEGGFLFSIGIESVEEFEDWPETSVLGTLEDTDGNAYYVEASFPSDVQYSDAGYDNYADMNEDISGIIASFTPANGYIWKE